MNLTKGKLIGTILGALGIGGTAGSFFDDKIAKIFHLRPHEHPQYALLENQTECNSTVEWKEIGTSGTYRLSQ